MVEYWILWIVCKHSSHGIVDHVDHVQVLRLWGESNLAERFNDIGRNLLSPVYDPKNDRQPTVDEALDTEVGDREQEVTSAVAKVQPKNTELAALEQTVQKSAKQGTVDVCVCVSLNPFSPTLFPIVAKIALPKCSGPY